MISNFSAGNAFASMVQQEDELTELHYVGRALKIAEHQYVENEFLRYTFVFDGKDKLSVLQVRTRLQ